jgi:NAD-dependent SIR2 family protein deacetylase
MTIYRCDKCGKDIERDKSVSVGRGFISSDIILCEDCAAPLIECLKKQNLFLSEKYIRAHYLKENSSNL